MALARLVQLEEEVRAGKVLLSPRCRLLSQLASIRERLERHDGRLDRCDSGQQDLIGRSLLHVEPGSSLQAAHVERSIRGAFDKCSRVRACLACTINPCICDLIAPLHIGRHHRIVVLMHCKEFLRTTNSGKLLLLAHPSASLLVSGLREHEEQLEEICSRPGACVLYPSAESITISQFRAQLAGTIESHRPGLWDTQQRAMRLAGPPPESQYGTRAHDADRGSRLCLDIIILDGTWSQARSIAIASSS